MKRFNFHILLLLLSCWCCTSDDENVLAPVEERTAAAIEALQNDLTAPANGWKINYQPTSGSGIFFMLLKFDDEGMVTIQSDVVDNNGEFIEQTIPYRIDNGLGLELIFETYGVFHYLFEKDQATFGGEFEFTYSGKQEGNLVFVSKSDRFDQTVLFFEPADAGDEALFSREITENLNQYSGLTPQIFGLVPPVQQVILNDRNISVFWSIDLSKRIIDFDMAGAGTTMAEINANANNIALNHTTGYALLEGRLVLINPLSFQIDGETITITEIALNNFSATGGPAFCALNTTSTPVYEGEAADLGKITILKSLFDSEGMNFQPMAERPYSVNALFIFDENGSSLLEEGIISEKFPTATGFFFCYGLNSTELPPYALGFIVEDANGVGQLYLREFEPTTTEGNKVAIKFTNNFYYSATPGPEDEQSLIDITNKIFEGGEVYASDLPGQGIPVFRLFNPCNQYEVFLVQ